MILISTLCVYALTRHISGCPWSAAAAALAYSLTPSMYFELGAGRVEELGFGLVAPFLLFAGLYLGRGRKRYLVLAFAAMALAVLAYMGTALVTAFLIPPLAFAYFLLAPHQESEDSTDPLPARPVLLRRAAWMAGVAFVLAIPVLIHLCDHLGVLWLGVGSRGGGASHGTSIGDWLELSTRHRMRLAHLMSPMPWGKGGGLGLVLPLAALVPLFAPCRRRRMTYPWLVGGLVLSALSLGPALFIPSGDPSPSSPYALLARWVPFLLRFHHPTRFLLLANVCLAVPAAVGLAWLAGVLKRSGRGPLLVSLVPPALVLLAAVQVLHRYPAATRKVEIPGEEHYRHVHGDQPEALLVVTNGGDRTDPVLAQVSHEVPFCCLALPLKLWPPKLVDHYHESLLFRYFSQEAHPHGGSGMRARAAFGGDRRTSLLEADASRLTDMGFSHLVLHLRNEVVAQPGTQNYGPLLMLYEVAQYHFGDPVYSNRGDTEIFEIYRIVPTLEASGTDR